LELVRVGRGAPDIRRPRPRSAVLAAGGAETEAVLLRLSGSRHGLSEVQKTMHPPLVTVHESAPGGEGEATVELIHDSLVTHWPALVGWLNEERRTLEIREDLEAAAATWVDLGQRYEDLPSAGLTAHFGRVAEQPTLPLSDEAGTYLARAQCRERRRRIVYAAVTYVPLLLLGLLAGLAWFDSPRLRRDLSASLERLGDMESVFHPEQGLASYQQALEIRQELAAADPRDVQAQRDLSVSYNKLGDVQLQLGDTAQALASYQQGLEISQELAAADPRDAQAQRDLSVSHNKLGDAYLQLGDTARALTSYQQGLEIRQKLAATDPGNADAQRDLSECYNKLGRVEEKRFAFDLAGRRHNEGRNALQSFIDRTGLNPFESELRELDERIAYCTAGKQAMDCLDATLQLPVWKKDEFLMVRIRGLLYRLGRTSPEKQPVGLAALDEAAKTAEALAAMSPSTPRNLYSAACGYGLCLGAIDVGTGQSDEGRAARQRYVDRDLALLRDAITAGYKDFDRMRKDADLAPLRDLPAFQELLAPQPAKSE
jgi:tetratricopeptide (TPR) repeat protein